MSMNEPGSIQAAEDWGVVLQSVPSKHKKEILKRLVGIFDLDKHDAEQILSNMPLILADNLSYGMATHIKDFFQKLGAVAETTNHDMIKKNCFQVVWPQAPDLSFFTKEEAEFAKTPVLGKKSHAKAVEIPSVAEKASIREVKSELSPTHEISLPESSVPESSADSSLPTVSEEKRAEGVSKWEPRAKELNEKLRKIHDEKQALHAKHAEVTEKAKKDFQKRLEEEKKKSGEIAKAYEDLQKKAKKNETLTREGEEWRSRAVALGEKVRELETNLMQKTSAVKLLTQEKEDLARRSAKAEEFASRLAELEKTVAAKEDERVALQRRISDFEKNSSAAQRELGNHQGREQDFVRKIEDLERKVREMTESLSARDSESAHFEKQVAELSGKAQGFESLRQEHAQFVQEQAVARKEYESKLSEQEARFAKIEEDHRRYRSCADRQTAAAARELIEWVRDVDTVRQGLQKLILSLGTDPAVLDAEKKPRLKSPLTRGPVASKVEKKRG